MTESTEPTMATAEQLVLTTLTLACMPMSGRALARALRLRWQTVFVAVRSLIVAGRVERHGRGRLTRFAPAGYAAWKERQARPAGLMGPGR